MKNHKNFLFFVSKGITFLTILFAFSFSNTFVFAQHDHSKHSSMNEKMKKADSIVREGTIDLKKIDENKDGKVFQDPMDWNVISDKPGKCPLCKMTLKEVSLKKAKENLLKNGFKVK